MRASGRSRRPARAPSPRGSSRPPSRAPGHGGHRPCPGSRASWRRSRRRPSPRTRSAPCSRGTSRCRSASRSAPSGWRPSAPGRSRRSPPGAGSTGAASRTCCRSGCPRACTRSRCFPMRNWRNSGDWLNRQRRFGLDRMRREELVRALLAEEVLLVGRLRVAVARGDHHPLDAEVHHLVEELPHPLGVGARRTAWCSSSRGSRGASASRIPSTAWS